MRAQVDFIFYLVDPPTGLCYYKDANNITRKAPISNTAIDSHLKNSPGKWMDQTLSFTRNSTYDGINRSYSQPLLFVKDGAAIIRELLYSGIGIETPLTLVVFKRNPSGIPTTYNLYYKGQIDLSKFNDSITEGIEVNLMEGGIIQLLKAYENTEFEIPCDGSISENKKINFDGLLLEDTFNYQFINVKNTINNRFITFPSIFLGNEGDNAGIEHNDPSLHDYGGAPSAGNEAIWDAPLASDWILFSQLPIDLEVTGTITVAGDIHEAPTGVKGIGYLHMFLATNSSQTIEINGEEYFTDSVNLIPAQPGIATAQGPTDSENEFVFLRQEQTYNFKQKISLKANEKLYMLAFTQFEGQNIEIVSGNFQISFNSMAAPTRAWGITWFDLFRLLIKNICQAASTTNQAFNYGFSSQLLSDNLNMLITCGDALRASGDSNYQKFFNAYQLNSTPSSNLTIIYGPAIKTTLKACFKAANVVFCGALGNQTINGVETLFFESKKYVFNPNANVMDVGEFANLKVSLMNELIFTGIKIGYQPQTYDQKAGKFESNTTAEWVTNIKSVTSTFLDLVSPYRADSYGIERLRGGVDGTSTTNNGSDNDVFIINTDINSVAKDFQDFSFLSLVTDYNTNPNQNIDLINKNAGQGIAVNKIDGSFLSLNNDHSIFILSEPGLSANKNISIFYKGFFLGNPANAVTGLPADFVKIDAYINGVLVSTNTFTATAASNPFTQGFAATRLCNTGDVIYLKISTSLNASGQLDQSIITITNPDLTPYWEVTGQDVPILPGTAVALIAMPNASAPQTASGIPVNGSGQYTLSFGFQYFLFNSILSDSFFSIGIDITQWLVGDPSESLTYKFYKNGVPILQESLPGSPSQLLLSSSMFVPSSQLNIGDVFFITADLTNMQTQITAMSIKFNSDIDIYNLKRVQYDFLDGVPNVAYLIRDSFGNPIIRTDIPGAAYNIEDLSPKRLLEKWSAYIRSVLYFWVGQSLQFCSLSKNQYLSTSFNNKVYTENAPYEISDMDAPFFYPLKVEGGVDTKDTFSAALTGAANSAVTGTFNGLNVIGFAQNLSQKPALNETQNWELRMSANVDLTKLFNLEYTGLNNYTMLPGTIRSATLNSVKFFPKGQTLDPKYRTPDPDIFPFAETVSGWINQDGYLNPWYVGYSVPLQFRTNGLSPVKVYLYDCCDKLISTTTFTQKFSPSVINPITLWEGSIDTSTVTPGNYYLVAQGGTSAGAFLQSEPIEIRAVDPSDRIILIEYSHSSNKEEMIFDTGFKACFYIPGFKDNKNKTSFKGAFYIDQPQNIIIENGITYRTGEIHLNQVPDYIIDQFMEVMMCDTVFVENVQTSLNTQEDPEVDFTKGAPKKNWKIITRMAKSSTGVSASASGAVQDATLIATVDARATSPNSNNDSQSNEPIITTINITV